MSTSQSGKERTREACAVAPHMGRQGYCPVCGVALPTRRRVWCSTRCRVDYLVNHRWSNARSSAKRRDRYRCRTCGAARTPERALEVNHIVPRVGAGYGWGCWNHLDNLETLCHACHVAVTNAQRAARKAATLAALAVDAATREVASLPCGTEQGGRAAA